MEALAIVFALLLAAVAWTIVVLSAVGYAVVSFLDAFCSSQLYGDGDDTTKGGD